MLLNFLSLALIILLAAYLANQGVLSSMIAFISAVFGSILAGALFESLQFLIAGYKPEYARGFTFLILFLVAFALCRFGADFAVPKNIKLPKMINRVLGGVFGLLGSLVIVGSILIGVQMLPLGTSIFGYDRFGGETGMQGDGAGVVATGSNIWLAPDRLTLAFWNASMGKSMGGDHSFGSVHPDLLTESYGYRNTVQSGVTQTLPPDLLKVDASCVTSDVADLKALNITEPGKVAAIVRAQITSSTEAPKVSMDAAASGAFFFVTPSEVRLVTNQGHQYYPIGYLDKGKQFVPTPLDSGQLAEDVNEGKNTLAEDWVFEINNDETPQFLEVKELARAPLSGIQSKRFPALLSTAYPPHAYRQQQGSLHIAASGFGADRIEWFKVYVINKTTTIKVAKGLYHPVYSNTVDALQQINNSSGVWFTMQGKPGVPSVSDLSQAHGGLQIFENQDDQQGLSWDQLIPDLFVAKSTTDGPRNLIDLPKYFQETIVPYFTPSILLKEGDVDSSGSLDLTDLPKGDLDVIAAAKTDKGFYVWAFGRSIVPKTKTEVDLTPNSASFKAVLK
jgi:hypothetical protein